MDPQLRTLLIDRLTNQLLSVRPGMTSEDRRREWATTFVDEVCPNLRRAIRDGQPWRARMITPYTRLLTAVQKQRLEDWLAS